MAIYQLHGNLWAKAGVKSKELGALHPRLHFLLGQTVEYLDMLKKDTVITQILAPYGTHRKGNAMDLRTSHLTPVEIYFIKEQFNDNYPYGIGYDGKQHETVVFHRQVRCKKCRKRYEVDPFEGPKPGMVCRECGGILFRDYGQHFHYQVKEVGENWKVWALPKIVMGNTG